jgi:hypothetical protein
MDDITHEKQGAKAHRMGSLLSRKMIFSVLGFLLLIVILSANILKNSVFMHPLKESNLLSQHAVPAHSSKEAWGVQGGAGSAISESGAAHRASLSPSAIAVFKDAEQHGHVHSSVVLFPQSGAVPKAAQAPISSVHTHLLSFIESLHSSGRNFRSDCDDPDFKDAQLVNSFQSRQVEVCAPAAHVEQNSASKISNSQIFCYQHQQARHSATDSICEGHNVALHLPSFEGVAMTGFVEATWMNMKHGSLQAACQPTGPFNKDKFPLCLSDWFVSGFRQVTLLHSAAAQL